MLSACVSVGHRRSFQIGFFSDLVVTVLADSRWPIVNLVLRRSVTKGVGSTVNAAKNLTIDMNKRKKWST